jgi:hypothetical protein
VTVKGSDPSSDLEVTVSLADISGTRADAGSDMKKVHEQDLFVNFEKDL